MNDTELLLYVPDVFDNAAACKISSEVDKLIDKNLKLRNVIIQLQTRLSYYIKEGK